MRRDEWSDFEQEMYWAVVEEACLAELARGVIDVSAGTVTKHGPWEPSACSAELLRWFDQGLIELYDTREGHPTNRPDLPGPPGSRHGPNGLVSPEMARTLLVDGNTGVITTNCGRAPGLS